MQKKANVLFIMADQLRYDCLGCNGSQAVKTPRIDRLAAESANFSSFFVQAPVCVPSRQTFFTGMYPRSHKNRVNYTSMDRDIENRLMQRHFKREGYNTAFAGKLHYFPPAREYALSTGFDDGLIHDGAGETDKYSDYAEWLRQKGAMPEDGSYRACRADKLNPYTAVLEDKYHETTWCGEKTREFLQKLSKKDEPFFLFSSYWKPHSSFEVPEPWASMHNETEIKMPEKVPKEYFDSLPRALKTFALRDGGDYNMPDEELAWQYRAYYGAISQIDREVGQTLDLLDELGLRDDTIVIFCSDHGDVMREHGMTGKNTFFDSSVHVPFMIRYPGTVVPGVYDQLTESTDVLESLFSICGFKPPYSGQGGDFSGLITGSGKPYAEREYVFAENIIPEVITGKPDPLTGERAGKDFYFVKNRGIKGVRHPDAKMIRSRKWKYNYYAGEEELYDLENDPEEMRNMAADPRFADIRDKMKTELLNRLVTADETGQIAPAWYIVKDERGEWGNFII
ncbi:MAG: sulfatase-like hydrolase/transferase [Oscillospiraceae bacterium]|nr:sulfatase-like hydrolase/transferase [Oscillospiraceae bacterium]